MVSKTTSRRRSERKKAIIMAIITGGVSVCENICRRMYEQSRRREGEEQAQIQAEDRNQRKQ